MQDAPPAAVTADTVALMSAVWKYVAQLSGVANSGRLAIRPATGRPSFAALMYPPYSGPADSNVQPNTAP
jgi:hypothetical protein